MQHTGAPGLTDFFRACGLTNRRENIGLKSLYSLKLFMNSTNKSWFFILRFVFFAIAFSKGSNSPMWRKKSQLDKIWSSGFRKIEIFATWCPIRASTAVLLYFMGIKIVNFVKTFKLWVNSHAVGKALALTNGFKIDFERSLISESAAFSYVNMLKFIITPVILIKIYEKNSLTEKNLFSIFY